MVKSAGSSWVAEKAVSIVNDRLTRDAAVLAADGQSAVVEVVHDDDFSEVDVVLDDDDCLVVEVAQTADGCSRVAEAEDRYPRAPMVTSLVLSAFRHPAVPFLYIKICLSPHKLLPHRSIHHLLDQIRECVNQNSRLNDQCNVHDPIDGFFKNLLLMGCGLLWNISLS